jgi:hypothetical protein
MPRESYDARALRSKAVASYAPAVLAAKKDKTIFDKKTQQSVSLEGSIRRCQQLQGVKLTEEESGTIRALDGLRDAEQHWHLIVDEGLLYLNIRAAVTLFDDLLDRLGLLRQCRACDEEVTGRGGLPPCVGGPPYGSLQQARCPSQVQPAGLRRLLR